MKKYPFFILTALALTGCSYNEPVASVSDQNSDNFSQYQDIINKANWYYNQLKGNTRASSPKVQNVELLQNHYTRSEGDSVETPIYYIVNYENEAGFVMLGGNETAEPLAAISEEGNLSFNDTINNPGLASYISSLYIPGIRPEPVIPYDSLRNESSLIINIDPLLHPNVRKWGKGLPLSRSLPTFGKWNIPTKVNATQLALLMAMTYFEWPNQETEYNFDWNGIKESTSHSHIGTILKLIGSNDFGLKVNYDINESTADPNNITAAADLMHYDCVSDGRTLENLSMNSKDSLRNLLPFIIWGENYSNGNKKVSTWVIDGVCTVLEIPGNSLKYYLHCVWGDYGIGNGYFLMSNLDYIGGYRDFKDATDGTDPRYVDSPEVPEYTNNSYLYSLVPDYH
ncbi:hypothetical protein HDR70_07150 [bacterium]|nr:hypothetical protein [bacterium]